MRRQADTASKVAETGAFNAQTDRGKTALLGVRQYYQNLASQAAANRDDKEVAALTRKMKLVDIVMESGLNVEDLNAGVLSELGFTRSTGSGEVKSDLLESTIPGYEGIIRIPQSKLLEGPISGIRKPKDTTVSDLPERKESRISSGDIASDEVKIVVNKSKEAVIPLINRVNENRLDSKVLWLWDSGGTLGDGRSKGARKINLKTYKDKQLTVGDIYKFMDKNSMSMEEVLESIGAL